MTELYFNLSKYSEFFLVKNAVRKSYIQLTRNMLIQFSVLVHTLWKFIC